MTPFIKHVLTTSVIGKMVAKLEEKFARKVLGVEVSLIISLLFTLTFATITIWYNMLQHYTFKTYAYDLGIYMQALYTTAFEGMLLYETPDIMNVPSGSFLGVHFAPLVFALVPIYRFFPQAETLFIIHNVVLGLSSTFIYLIAREGLGIRWIALAFQLTYLMNPLIHAAIMFQFHIEVFVPLFGLAALYFLSKRKIEFYIINLVLLTLTIDFAIFIAGAIALYGLIKAKTKKERVVHVSILVYSMFMVFIAIKVISMFGPEPLSFGGQLSILGSNWREILTNLLTNPKLVVKAISYDLLLKMANLFILVMPYLPVILNDMFSWIPALPYLLLSFLTNRISIYIIGWHIQGLFAFPFIVYAAIKGMEKYCKKSNEGKIYASVQMIKILALALIAMLLLSPAIIPEDFIKSMPTGATLGASYVSRPHFDEGVLILREIVKSIPPNASVLAQNNIFPHLANRIHSYVWIPPNISVDYAVADLNNHDYYTKHGDVPFNQQFESLLLSRYKVCVYGYGKILIAKESCPIHIFIPFKSVYNSENITAGSFRIVKFENISVLQYVPKSSTFIFGPYITLPPGTYNVTFWLKLDSSNYEGYVATLDVATDLGKNILVERPVYGFEITDWIPITLTFSCNTIIHNVEFRVRDVSPNIGYRLYLRSIEVSQINLEPAKKWYIYLTYNNLIVKGAVIENGLIIHRPQDPRDVIWYGPYIPLERGNYTLTLFLKFKNTSLIGNEPIIQIDIVAQKGTQRLAIFNITVREVCENTWINIKLNFALNESYDDVEVRGLNVAKGVEVELAYILVEKVN